MAAFIPAVHNSTANTHEPLGATDTLSVNAAQATALTGALDAATETARGTIELATTAEATTGTDTTRAVTPAGLAAALGALGDVRLTTLGFDAVTGVLTATLSNATTVTTTITDIEAATATAPATTTNATIPTVYYGTNTARLGNPDGWWTINGKKVPYYN
jgi:hypothetical protein